MNRESMLRRLSYLRLAETFNILWLPLCCWFVVGYTLKLPTWTLYATSMGLIVYILAQGSLYWHLKYRMVKKDRQALPDYFRPLYLTFKWSTVVLLALYPSLALILALTDRTAANEPLWASLLYGFAWLEYVNYYHRQLMHDTANDLRYLIQHRRLRRSHLATDLAAAGQQATQTRP